MKKTAILVLVLAALASGCSIRFGAGSSAHPRHRDTLFGGEVEATPGPHGPNCADIIAGEGQTFDSGRETFYAAIARREGLTTHEQCHLIDATMAMTFDSSRERPLATLAGNPTLTPQSRMYLAERLHDLTFDSSRERVQAALLANPPRS